MPPPWPSSVTREKLLTGSFLLRHHTRARWPRNDRGRNKCRPRALPCPAPRLALQVEGYGCVLVTSQAKAA
eukprot:SAG25_NODE_6237_length_576_cov_0.754717_1_plen_70_part_10